jgi:MoaA/NifB/PqqE/SkfB family radical SAM enzyme
MVDVSFLNRKAISELDRAWALLRYPLFKRRLLTLLPRSIPSISIETTNICNANCIFCAYQYQTRPRGVMSMDLFRKVIDDYADLGGRVLSLTPTVGDPLVDFDCLARISYARSKQIMSIAMYSNMISLERVGATALAISGITSLTVSVSGFDENMYKRVYRSQMYKQVYGNIQRFARANAAAGSPVDFRVQMRVDRPLSEVVKYPDHVALAALLGKHKIDVKLRYDDWSGYITPNQLSGTMKIRKVIPLRISPCSELYSGPMVYWDGSVGACGCRDVNASELIIGNVKDSHLGDIWFGGNIRKLRDEFMTASIKPICANCKHYNNISHLLSSHNKQYLLSIKPCSYKAPDGEWPRCERQHELAQLDGN